MNKLFTLIFMVLVMITIQESKGQSFQLLLPVAVPDTVYGKPEQSELTSSSEIKNITSANASYRIAVSPIYLTPGHLLSICDCENCYMPTESFYQTPNPCVLAPGATSGGAVHLYLYPNNTEGTSIANVNFINANNQMDNVSYQAVYIVGGTDVNRPIELTLLPTDVMPNPASESVMIKNIPAHFSELLNLEVFDSKGKIVGKNIIETNTTDFRINTSSYLSGTYYYNIYSSGKVIKTGSFVILQ